MGEVSISGFTYPKRDAFWNTEGLLSANFPPLPCYSKGLEKWSSVSLATNWPNSPNVSWKIIQEQPGHRNTWAEGKTGKDNFPCFSCVALSVEPPPSTHHLLWWDFAAVVGYGGDTPDCRWDWVSEGGQQLPLALPREPPDREALREACAFLRP